MGYTLRLLVHIPHALVGGHEERIRLLGAALFQMRTARQDLIVDLRGCEADGFGVGD